MYPALLLRLEGAALFFGALFFYHSLRFSWVLFIALFLWPDILMLGYLLNPRLGARLYNLAHTDIFPTALAPWHLRCTGHLCWHSPSFG